MSKAPSRAAKTKTVKDVKGKTVTSEKLPATLFEIVPGKFNENDWNNMISNDDSQEFVWEIVDEIIDNSEKIIFNNYIERQSIPYTVNEAKTAILHLIDWLFIPSEKSEDLNKIYVEDTEPPSAIIDSWAPGYIQAYLDDNQDRIDALDQNDKNESNESKTLLNELNSLMDQNTLQISNSVDEQVNDTNEASSRMLAISEQDNTQNTVPTISMDTSLKQKSHVKTKTHTKSFDLSKSLDYDNHTEKMKYGSFGGDSYREPTKNRAKYIENESKKMEEAIQRAPIACHSILKSLLSRPAGYRELEIDQNGKVVSVMKIDSDRLPLNNIRPRFNIVDNNKHDFPSIAQKKKSKTTKEDKTSETCSETRKKQYEELDYILEPASGVVFKMGQITRVGAKKPVAINKSSALEKSENQLKPLRKINDNEVSLNRNAIEQILEQQLETTNINSLNRFKPIPPINKETSVN